MILTCSLQVRRRLRLPCFYGRTLSCTVLAVCTGPPCQEMTQIHMATKSLASTDFCQITLIPNSAYKRPITDPKKHTWSLLLSNNSCHTHGLLVRGHPQDLPRQSKTVQKGRIIMGGGGRPLWYLSTCPGCRCAGSLGLHIW
jgi:hypothetical protein